MESEFSQVKLTVIANGAEMLSTEFAGQIIAGRQDLGDPEPFVCVDGKVIVASIQERNVSRRHISFELLNNKAVKITNLSQFRPIEFCGVQASRLDPGDTVVVDPPFEIMIGPNRAIAIEPTTPSMDRQMFQTLTHVSLAPGNRADEIESWTEFTAKEQPAHLSMLLKMLRRMASVILPSSTRSLFNESVDALVTILQFDRAAGMRWNGAAWEVESLSVHNGNHSSETLIPSQSILTEMRRERRTMLYSPSQSASSGASLIGVHALAAAPILNVDGEVIGALYGVRSHGNEISELEGILVQMLAASVASGIARIEQEQKAVKSRVLFEQFFSPKLAERLESEPALLQGREAVVTVLFCDIRGFSSVSHKVGPQRTIEWIRNVLDHLSQCVTQNEGVLVDFIGDELMAMWGAPDNQHDHAQRACRAALQMVEKLPEISQNWRDKIGSETEIGIGINSGLAYVGNTGSERKFKYGPLGNTVNLASRIQGMTKFVRSGMLVTGSTVEELKAQFPTRLLAKVRVVNINEAIDLYELAKDAAGPWKKLREGYEQALRQFERRNFQASAGILGRLLEEHPNDGPSLLLLSRAVNAMINGPDADHPVWTMNQK
jgi:adenylate cyclase